METSFDRVVDRRATNDIKWRRGAVESQLGVPIREGMIPMWIADMDFACYQGIIDAVKARGDKEIYGYCAPGEQYYTSLQYWFKEQYGCDLDPRCVTVTPSVVAAINIAIRAFTQVGDGVIIQQPVYDPFASLVKKTGRVVVNNALAIKNGRYEMDYQLLEKQAADPRNKLLVLCSPHNPVGRVWERTELEQLDSICRRHGVLVVSDEIHSDIVFNGKKHTPFLSLGEKAADNTILCHAPSKTFNVAGLKISNIIIPNEKLRSAFVMQQEAMSLDVRNTFGIEAVEAAYTPGGKAWVEQLLEYLEKNITLVEQAVARMPGVSFASPEGTFLGWLDFSGTGLSGEDIRQRIIVDAAVVCVPGEWFGPGGERHLRINFGCPSAMLLDALKRIAEAIQ